MCGFRGLCADAGVGAGSAGGHVGLCTTGRPRGGSRAAGGFPLPRANARASAGTIFQGTACKRGRGEVRRIGLEPTGGATGALRRFLRIPLSRIMIEWRKGSHSERGWQMADAPTEQPGAQAHGQTHIGCAVPTDLYRQVKGILGTQGRTLRDVVIQALRQVVEDAQRNKGETSWLPALAPAPEPPLGEQPERWHDLLTLEGQAEEVRGPMTVAEMEHRRYVPPQEQSSPRVHQLEQSVPFADSTSRVPGEAMPGRDSFTLVAGGTVGLPASQHRVVPFPYMHWCVRCNEIFTSKEADPERCGKCKNLYWRGDFLHDVRRHRAKHRKESASA